MEHWQIDHKDEGEEIIKLEWKNQGSDMVRIDQFVFSIYARTVSVRFSSSPSSKEFLVALWSLEYHVTKNSKCNTYIWEIKNN